MGLINRRNKEIESKNKVSKTSVDNSLRVSLCITPDGRLQIDYYNPKADFKQFYNSTRLIVGKSINIAGHDVSQCQVSWYSSSDNENLRTGERIGRAVAYKDILTQLDIDALQHDSVYLETVMRDLLEQNRVERYLRKGLQDYPERPCGQYVGEISTENYGKVFNISIGKIAHNLPEMQNKRLEEKRIALKEKNRREKIAKLQGEINELNGR